MQLPEWFDSGKDEALFLRTVLDHVSDCLVVVDTNGRVVLINRPYCQLLEAKEEDVIGRHITEVATSQTRLHEVARGEAVINGAPLTVKGHQLITRQVPVLHGNEIVGAVGMALFSNMALLKETFALASSSGVEIQKSRNPWSVRYTVDDILGTGDYIEALRRDIRKAAVYDVPVLIQGETGTGKELTAHAIHAMSARAQKPLVWLNCASIPDDLIDAELFGYEGGAFTGARSRGKPGKFELANGGTLFLDEIGDMSLSLQGSLLRAIQTQEIVRVGGIAPIKVDTRIICATNKPLERLVQAGQFRADLFYRINVMGIEMQPLRERPDLPFLIGQILSRLAIQIGAETPPPPQTFFDELCAYSWPGNVRELEAVLLRYLISGRTDLSRIPNGTMAAAEAASRVAENLHAEAARPSTEHLSLQDHLKNQKARHIREALIAAGNDKQKAAKLLGISRATLYRELQRLPS